MITMQPLSLHAGGADEQGLYLYRVRFDRDGTEVEYTFTVDTSDIPGVTADDEFVKATVLDPLAPALYQAVLEFHKARHGESIAERTSAKTA